MGSTYGNPSATRSDRLPASMLFGIGLVGAGLLSAAIPGDSEGGYD